MIHHFLSKSILGSAICQYVKQIPKDTFTSDQKMASLDPKREFSQLYQNGTLFLYTPHKLLLCNYNFFSNHFIPLINYMNSILLCNPLGKLTIHDNTIYYSEKTVIQKEKLHISIHDFLIKIYEFL